MEHAELASLLRARWRRATYLPGFADCEPPAELLRRLPSDYQAMINEFGGHEGWLGPQYLCLYRLGELDAANACYDIEAAWPGAVLFGTDRASEAYVFTGDGERVARVPFIGMSREEADPVWPSFAAMIKAYGSTEPTDHVRPEYVGKQVHLVMPVELGGNPEDPRNVQLVPVDSHGQLVRYWRGVVRRARAT